MKLTTTLLALIVSVPLAARADPAPLDSSIFAPPGDGPLLQRRGDYYGPPRYGSPYQRDARTGLLLSIGAGGGSLYLSNEGSRRIGAADLDLRLGYGFSDRFQMFVDFNADGGSNLSGRDVGSWTWTVRGQTLLVGDRAGNGLNLNLGAGFGGLTYSQTGDRSSGPTGFAVAGGLSFDARVSRYVALSPELFFTWHQIPNQPDFSNDVSSIYGVRLNLVWYVH